MDYMETLQVADYQKKLVGRFVAKLMEHLKGIPPSETIALNDIDSWIESNSVKSPIFRRPAKVDGNFTFTPPVKFSLVGSYCYGNCRAAKPVVDIAFKIPKEFWNKKDNFNQRFLRKRAFFLLWIGVHLRDHGKDFIKEVKFVYDYDPTRPVLILKAKNKKIKFQFRLLPVTKEPFNPHRFIPDRNNIRPQWYQELPETDNEDTASYLPTPFYNSLILHDLNLMANHKLVKANLAHDDVKKCVVLVKTWATNKGYNNILDFPLTLFIVYLLRQGILNEKMNYLQLFRKVLLQFSDSNWCERPIFLCEEEPPFMEHFKKGHEVIFLDESGLFNVCYLLTKDTYLGAKMEARITLEKLDSESGLSLIQALSPVDFYDKYDNILILNGECMKKACTPIEESKQVIMDHCGHMAPFFIRYIISILSKALGDRVKLIQHSLRDFSSISWDISEGPVAVSKLFQDVKFGFILDQAHVLESIHKGPSADRPEAEDFREFWGEKSQLRRFQEGMICETVFWEASSLADRRAIVGRIVKYILSFHANILKKLIRITGSELDSFLWPSKIPPAAYGTGEEANKLVISNFESFAKKLRNLKDLPLTLSSVQGVSPAFRGSDVFPPTPTNPTYPSIYYNTKENCTSFSEETEKIHPKSCDPIDVVIHLETSGKWPSDLEALKRVKAAFIIEMGELVSAQFGLLCKPQKRFLDVWHEGLVFRVHIGCNKELHLMRQITTPEGMIKTIESEEADRIGQFTIHLPIITSALNSVNSRFTAFSSVSRLAKRWVSCHLMTDHLDEIAIELIVAHLFLQPHPYTVPLSPLTGLIRFLKMLFTFPWARKPLIVNFNDELKWEDIQEIQSHFNENRANLPAIFISTPFDKTKSMWTRDKPVQAALNRLIFLANKCHVYLKSCIENIWKSDFEPLFHTATDIFDLTISLDKRLVPNFSLNLNFTRHNLTDKEAEKTAKRIETVETFPIVGFNPVTRYITELKRHFSNYALFFYDRFGGIKIHFIWKPHTFDPKPLYLANVTDCKLTETTSKSGRPNIVFNVEAVLEDLYILGDGLVTSIDANVSKWE